MTRVPETYYAPRRKTIVETCAVSGGLLIALWRGAAMWILVLRGIRRHNAAGGLWNLELQVFMGGVEGAVLGAAIGWAIGYLWEHLHRRRRARSVSSGSARL